ncbi:MAG: alpha/beta hydrolase [Oscillospiraceae bacterium]|nr:alpha/beta hydrolase [Oscillospiraceae bacterium]
MTEKTWQTDKGVIHYWTNAIVPEKETLLFLPGLTADHRLFDRQIAFFKHEYNLLVWDAPGHGASRPFSLDFSLMDKAGWLHDILEKEGISFPFLIGQSMGGYVAQCYLQRYPGTVRGFVSIDSAPLKRRYVTALEIWLLKRCEPIYRYYPWNALIQSGSKGCADTAYGQKLMADMMRQYSPKEYSRLAGHGYGMLASAMEADLPYPSGCPALLLCGDHDRAGSTKRYNRHWAEGENLPLVWIKGAGHNPNTDRPQEVNQWIGRFVAENRAD